MVAVTQRGRAGMGGYCSGRRGGRPLAEEARRIDLPWMLRTGRARAGCDMSGVLRWNCGGVPAGSVGYTMRLSDPDDASMILRFTRGSGERAEQVEQFVRLVSTRPHYGGVRWWMICPNCGGRCAKLFMPPGASRFASRKAWGIAYRSQRTAPRDLPFERLYRLQRRLGLEEDCELPIIRPKGMWRRTYAPLEARYWELDAQCNDQMVATYARLRGLVD